MKNVEIEIKYGIRDKQTADAIAADPGFWELSSQSQWQRMPVKAMYYDTGNLDLHQAGIVYRVRSEGEQPVATVKKGKNPKSNLQQRLEWNVEVDSLEPDVSPFKDTEIGKELEAASRKGILHPLFSCVFERRFITLYLDRDTKGELAVDVGYITAGDLTEPICELELELKQGNPQVMIAMANRIAQEFSLVPEPRSKYSRGLALFHSSTLQG